ncbi:Hpt domain-containing protein [Vibrio agarivorans]|uniref:Hpt domain-containing protein n=1 Tax=Vibrio agarivorans TaxID=153622 RepID=UPI0022310AFB|nr:Hpt domain-containing protein [Vibrio agarivorans]MDN3661252.1 Hpt domain-containing protein [Vibrio agarivorans]
MDVMNKVKIDDLGAQIGKENLAPLFEIFTNELADYQQSLKTIEGDMLSKLLGEICHALKSSAASFGADALCEHAIAVDAQFKQGADLTQGEWVDTTLTLLEQTHIAYTQFSQ